jgi:hypothetical protein
MEERIDDGDLLLQSEVSELPPDNHRKNCENEMSPLSSLLSSDASNPNSIREIYCGVIDTNADNTDSHASQESIDAGLVLLLSV